MYAENFERVPGAATAARRLVSTALDAWELSQLADPATLVVSELVSNAVRHATGEGMRITVHRLPTGRVHLAVLDRDPTRPQVQPPTPDGVSGRGLLLVEAMSFAWGVDMLPGGKRVWSVLEAAS
ncbi:ATP-binding protein [Streptomyces sp. HPF1205]|uniref:ATP-binding protein n=1 Tax=Streptomyces sp. HPF1205 TaxID=2873262 RepID=UPI001CEDC9A7|nr:ATP-binding protein [Streptomyces sp. HPF1205]